MAIDRDATLKKAEKLLRQGRLDQAIAEYQRILAVQPEDWGTVNVVGDLLVRGGQIEGGIAHFARIADHLFDEGFFPRATAVYKKILKLAPDNDHAALRTADIAEQQGLVAEAKTALAHVAARRLKRGDKTGAAEIHLRLGQLDPGDLEAAVSAAKAAADLGNLQGAVGRLVEIADQYYRQGKADDSSRILGEALALESGNQAVRSALTRQLLETGALGRAVEYASSAPEFKAIASAYYARGCGDEALQVLQWALDQDPSDVAIRRQLVRSYVGRAEFDRARPLLDAPGEDAELLMALAEVEMATGRRQQGRDAAARLAAAEPARRDELVQLGLRLAGSNAESAFDCIDVGTDAAIADHDFPGAAQALNDYVALVPGHVPALMKLVEVCVDGSLGAAMYVAQAQLADAYLASGLAAEARVIAEDLFAREPWEPSNIERFRKALAMLGESDPDSVIADRLSGDSPFTSTDLTLDFSFNELARSDDAPTPPDAAGPSAAIDVPPSMSATVVAGRGDAEPAPEPNREDPAGADEAASDDVVEIDLDGALGTWDEGGVAAEVAVPPAPALAGLERVFEGFREEAVRQVADSAGTYLQQALTLEEAGQPERAIRLFERAARSPMFRLRATSGLARIHRRLGHTHEAIEWLERAAESSMPGTEESHELLYDLGLLLAEAGETDRALAVLIELQADVPDYRDVARQVARLSQKA